jgi:hypothetical protein
MKVVQVNGVNWDKDLLTSLIQTSDLAVKRAITTLYEGQREDEKRQSSTKYQNGIGFTPADARFLSSLAKQIESGRELTVKQIAAARPRLFKYVGQIFRKMEARHGSIKIKK